MLVCQQNRLDLNSRISLLLLTAPWAVCRPPLEARLSPNSAAAARCQHFHPLRVPCGRWRTSRPQPSQIDPWLYKWLAGPSSAQVSGTVGEGADAAVGAGCGQHRMPRAKSHVGHGVAVPAQPTEHPAAACPASQVVDGGEAVVAAARSVAQARAQGRPGRCGPRSVPARQPPRARGGTEVPERRGAVRGSSEEEVVGGRGVGGQGPRCVGAQAEAVDRAFVRGREGVHQRAGRQIPGLHPAVRPRRQDLFRHPLWQQARRLYEETRSVDIKDTNARMHERAYECEDEEQMYSCAREGEK